MKQRVIVAKPPVYEACAHAFGADVIVGKPILWSWGDVIYNPTDVDIPPELFAHEAVHGARQIADVRAWWAQYLKDPQFRYEEEAIAHSAEWRDYVRRRPGRNNARMLDAIAERLASPLYGRMVGIEAARMAVLGQ